MSREPRLRTFEFDAEKAQGVDCLRRGTGVKKTPSFGAVKLNKILYYADFDAYRLLGQPITGATYRKLQAGPAPKQLLSARDELIQEGRLWLDSRQYFNRIQKRLLLVEGESPNSELFAPEERQVIDSVIEFLWPMSAREASDYSHREPGWMLAGEREEIPYESAFLSADPIDQETEETGIRIGREFLASRR